MKEGQKLWTKDELILAVNFVSVDPSLKARGIEGASNLSRVATYHSEWLRRIKDV